MTKPPKYLFVDDSLGPGGDAEHFLTLLKREDVLLIELMFPDRQALLVPETSLPPDIAGFILDINLRDRVPDGGERFQGTGAGLAQDIRLLQSLGGSEGQRSRPIVRLCAAQVFQRYLAGDDSTIDIFDLGYSKETIADSITDARHAIASLPDLYEALIAAEGDSNAAPSLLGLGAAQYNSLHSSFRSALEFELTRKPHEAASFLIRYLLEPTGPLISEDVLAIRLGIDRFRSQGWSKVRDHFSPAMYIGRASTGFPRWWSDQLLTIWSGLSALPLYRMTIVERVAQLSQCSFGDLVPLAVDSRSPGERPWLLSQSEDPQLRLPADPEYAFPISLSIKPWLDEVVWCKEQAKRNRRSPLLSTESQRRLSRDLKSAAGQ